MNVFPLDRPAVWLAPMEQVTDPVFRALCRARGAGVCFTEFVNAGALLADEHDARRKLAIDADDAPTAIQVYGADAPTLAQAARIAGEISPPFVDLNCGCWTPRVAAKGAGAGWLRDPDAMVAMARLVVQTCAVPVTVKTRIGLGTEARMPIVDLARRLEDTGIAAITLHCRTARAGHDGEADWRWAARVKEAVGIAVIVNGDVRTAADAHRALAETKCDGVMIGRRAIEHPWVFREVTARLAGESAPPRPTTDDRVALVREHLARASERYGERSAVRIVRRFVAGYLRAVPAVGPWVERLQGCTTALAMHETLDGLLAHAAHSDAIAGAGAGPARASTSARRGASGSAVRLRYEDAWGDDRDEGARR